MKTLDYLFAARPLLHLPIWSVYLVSFHYHQQLSQKSLGWSELGIMAIVSMVAAGGYFLNQIYDYRSDLINEKLGFLQRGLIAPVRARVIFLVLATVALGAGALYSWWLLFLLAQGVLLAILYSVPPVSLMNRPFAGLLVNAYTFGWLVPLSIMPEANLDNMGRLGWDTPVYFTLAVASIHILTTLPDREGDRRAAKRTIAVLLGARWSKVIAFFLQVAAAVIAYWSGFAPLFYLALVSAAAVAGSLMIPATRLTLFAAKLPVLLTTILAGFFFPLYFLFIVVLLGVTRVYYLKRFQIVYPRMD